jgi:hypothetical protein
MTMALMLDADTNTNTSTYCTASAFSAVSYEACVRVLRPGYETTLVLHRPRYEPHPHLH